MWWFARKNLPQATGPYVPGCIDLMLDYSITGLFVTIFYPTECTVNDKVQSTKWTKWISHDAYVSGMAKVMRIFEFIIRLVLIWFYSVTSLCMPVVYGEKIRTRNKLKCIIYSHGMGAYRLLSSSLCYELASRGFLVVAIEHRDRSACSTYYYQTEENARNDVKTMIEYKNVVFTENQFEDCRKMVNYRADEVSRTLDLLKQLNEGNVPNNVLDQLGSQKNIDFKFKDLKGLLDVENVIISGHSFGGATAILAMSKRSELKLGILYDPWMYALKDKNLHEKLDQPLIFVNSQTFHNKPNVMGMEKFLSKENREMYTIIGTDHRLHTDFIFIMGSWRLHIFTKKIDPEVAVRLNNSLVLRFLNKHIGFPKNVVEESNNALNKFSSYYEEGLTKPWV